MQSLFVRSVAAVRVQGGSRAGRCSPNVASLPSWWRAMRESTANASSGRQRKRWAGLVLSAVVVATGASLAWRVLERTPTGKWVLNLEAQDAVDRRAHLQLQQLIAGAERKHREGQAAAGTPILGEEEVRSVARRVIDAAKQQGTRAASLPWSLVLLDDSDAVAMALEDGTVVLSHGMIFRAENSDELAAVVAHEVSHVLCRHGVTMRSLELAKSKSSKKESISALKAFRVQCELEADVLGVRLMRQAGYKGEAALSMLAKGEERPVGYDWHPSKDQRLAVLTEELQKE